MSRSDRTHAVVLTAPPGAGLPDATIADIADALDRPGEPRRLSADAAEVSVPGPQTAPAHGIDVNCVPLAGRRKRLLVADMDSTVIGVECIDEVAAAFGVGAEVAAITERAMRGELAFEAALAARVALLAGLEVERLAEVYAARVRLTPGARALVATMRAHGAHTLLVSGGFTFFAERVARDAGFDAHRANRLEIAAGRLTGRVVAPVLGREAKLAALRDVASRLGLTPADALAVGDGANDLAMIRAAGLGVAFRAKPVVAEAARARIDHGDLTALLYLQGFSGDEIVAG